jgi:hypothetical protein
MIRKLGGSLTELEITDSTALEILVALESTILDTINPPLRQIYLIHPDELTRLFHPRFSAVNLLHHRMPKVRQIHLL